MVGLAKAYRSVGAGSRASYSGDTHSARSRHSLSYVLSACSAAESIQRFPDLIFTHKKLLQARSLTSPDAWVLPPALSFYAKSRYLFLWGTITEVCNRERYDYLTQRDNFIFGDKLSEHYYIVSYVSNTGNVNDSDWNPPKISAVQLSAAITACARIHMYQYISRSDCYYTDTDSAVLGSPLPED
ncbi:hypothetical protein SLE2022_403860 [Rubroshorea leprosula]